MPLYLLIGYANINPLFRQKKLDYKFTVLAKFLSTLQFAWSGGNQCNYKHATIKKTTSLTIWSITKKKKGRETKRPEVI